MICNSSSGLKRTLGESLDVERIQDEKKAQMDYAVRFDRGQGRKEQVERQFATEAERIARLEKGVAELRAAAGEMEDGEFGLRYEALRLEIDEVCEHIARYGDEAGEERNYKTEFVDLREIRGLDEFLDKLPMYWVPRKEEIGRILSVAKQMHDARGAAEDEPVTILDVGGANGALGKLVVDLAKENGLRIEYTVVDPDGPAVEPAAKAYVDIPELKFCVETAGENAAKLHGQDHELRDLLAQRARLMKDGDAKLRDLATVVDVVVKQICNGELDAAAAARARDLLKMDFGLEIEPTETPEEFMDRLDTHYDSDTGAELPGAKQLFFARQQSLVESLTRDIESRLAAKPPDHDLVINSWMPPTMDFTKDIRTANGAAIVYILETWGATGRQAQADYPEKPSRVGEEDSYGPGDLYRQESVWVGHSVPQMVQEDDEKSAFRSGVHDYSNAFLIERRRGGFAGGHLDPDPEMAGLKIEGKYPWEEKLESRKGMISPVEPVRARGRRKDYHDDLLDLIKQSRKRGEKKGR